MPVRRQQNRVALNESATLFKIGEKTSPILPRFFMVYSVCIKGLKYVEIFHLYDPLSRCYTNFV